MERIRKLNDLKQTIACIKESLSQIEKQSSAISEKIRSGKLLPAQAAMELAEALEKYWPLELQLRQMGKELAVDLGEDVQEVEEAVAAFEESQKLGRLREIVLDYFRLNTQAEEIKNVLESTKWALAEQCAKAMDEIFIDPYEYVVSSAKNNSGMTLEQAKLVSKHISDDLGYAAYSGQITFDESLDISPYASSLPFFAGEEKKAEREPDKPDVVLSPPDVSGEPEDEATPAPREDGAAEAVSPASEAMEAITETEAEAAEPSPETAPARAPEAEAEPEPEPVSKKERELEAKTETEAEPEPQAEPEEPPVLITAANAGKIKKDKPGASEFKNTITKYARQYKHVFAILPLMTHLGLLEREQVYLAGHCLSGFPAEDGFREQLNEALELLSSKGLLVHFQYEEEDGRPVDAYGLSEYCAGCLKKRDVLSISYWTPRVGSRLIPCGETIDLKDLKRVIRANATLLEYLREAKAALDMKEFEAVAKSVKWAGSCYTVTCLHEGEKYPCVVYAEGLDLRNPPAENIIFTPEQAPEVSRYADRFTALFAVEDGEMVRLEDGKAPENAASEEKQQEDGAFAAGPEEERKAEPENVLSESGEEPEAPSGAPEEEEKAGAATADAPPEAKAEPLQEAAAPAAEEGVPQEAAASSDDHEAPWDAAPPAARDEAPQAAETAPAGREADTPPADEDFCSRVYALLSTPVSSEQELRTAVSNALLLARTAGFIPGYEKVRRLSRRLQLATKTIFDDCAYSLYDLADAFTDAGDLDEAVTLAAYCFAMLTPAKAYDHPLFAQCKAYSDRFEDTFPSFGSVGFKNFYNKLLSVHETIPTGFTPAVISLLGNDSEMESYIKKLQTEAKGYLNVPTPNTRIKDLPRLYQSCFGPGSDLYHCMGIIAANKEESLEDVKLILSDYCLEENGTFSLDRSRIEEKLDAEWEKAYSGKKFKLDYGARDQAIKHFRVRLELMLTWAERLSEKAKQGDNLERLKTLRDELLAYISDLEAEDGWKKAPCANVVRFMLHRMRWILTGRQDSWLFSDLLLTGVFSLDTDGLPILDETLTRVRYNEPWRGALRHIEARRRPASEVRDEILGAFGADAELFDNLRQLMMLGRWQGSPDEDYKVTEQQLKQARAKAELKNERFSERLELAYMYGQINETEKETLADIVKQYKDLFFEIGDFACWRRFLEGLEKQIDEFAGRRLQSLRAELKIRRDKEPDLPLLREAERLLEEDRNFAVAEEYINQYDNGEKVLSSLATVLHDKDYFSDFLEKEESIRYYCKEKSGLALKNIWRAHFEKNLPKDWTVRNRKDSEELVSSWPVRKDATTAATIQNLFNCLGFEVKSAVKATGTKVELFKLTIAPTPRSKADYTHPISAFGTQLKSPLHVVVLYGNYTDKQLVDTVTSLDLRDISFVLIDRPLNISTKRNIAEIYHTETSRQNPFLIIDQTLLLYLSQLQITERLPALLKCTLPFSSYQPFVQGSGPIPDEMFFGRIHELSQIIDTNGPCVVYGGRQLGKTALLMRAESRCHNPENKYYAFRVSIEYAKQEKEVVSKIVDEIRKKTNNAIAISPCDTLKELCDQIDSCFRKGEIVRMHLFIDEVDDFLASIAKDRYKQLQPLVDLRRQTTNDFKFVISGLHNVCRAKNATEENGIFGQLGTPLCIKPLSPNEALQLLSKPLRYLGFQLNDPYPQLKTILTKTNYYPGILQFFGYMLVDALNHRYAKYYQAAKGNPPFTLQDEQLGAIISSADLNQSIKDKFRLSLELDKRYFMLARCISMLYLYYEKDLQLGSWLGFPVNKIMELAEFYEIRCLQNETEHDYIVLLDEMVDMGILSKPGDLPLYRLRRSSFIDIIGNDLDALEKEIISNNQEV